MTPNNHDGQTVDAVGFVKQLDRDSEFEFAGRRFDVTTRNSVYHVDDAAGTIAKNEGEPLPGKVRGATFGGSMLMVGRLLVDAHMEFVWPGADGHPDVWTSTPVRSIEPVL